MPFLGIGRSASRQRTRSESGSSHVSKSGSGGLSVGTLNASSSGGSIGGSSSGKGNGSAEHIKLFVTSDSASENESQPQKQQPPPPLPPQPSQPPQPSSMSRRQANASSSSQKPMDRHALSNYYSRRSLTEDDQMFVAAEDATPRTALFAQDVTSSPPTSRSGTLKDSPSLSNAQQVKERYMTAEDTRKRTASVPNLAAAKAAAGDAPPNGENASQQEPVPPVPPVPDAWKPAPPAPTPEKSKEKGRSPWRKQSRGPDPSSGIAGALAATGMAMAHPHSTLIPPVPPLPSGARRSASQVSLGLDDGEGGGRHYQSQLYAPRQSDDTDASESETDESRLFLDEDAMPVTGFAVASSKRNIEFHEMFPQVPPDDYLIEDYGCALQREILVQGRLYISENHLCFHANIFGWVSNEVIPFADLISMEKKMTALIIPNAIQIATRQKVYTFTSFMGRDTAYDVMHNIWRLARPAGLESPPQASMEDVTAGSSSAASAVNGVGAPGASVVRKATTCACGDNKEHYPTVCMDSTFPGTPEKIYNLLFASGFIKDFLKDEQRLIDLQISDWAPTTPGSSLLIRNMSYIKPLSGSIGPKQTRCELRDEMIHYDPDRYITMLTTTRTPEVPSGSSFSVKSRTCITWAGAVAARVVVTSAVEWTGSSFIKGIITSSAMEGQRKYNTDLEPFARNYIEAHKTEFVPQGMEALAKVETETIHLGESPTSPTGTLKEPAAGSQVHDERWLQWALDTFRGASKVAQQSFTGALEILLDVPLDTRAVLLLVIVVLVATNIASLLAVRKAPIATSVSNADNGRRNEVSDTLRTILEEMRRAAPTAAPAPSQQEPSVIVVPADGDWRSETAEIGRALDAIEERVRRLRLAMIQDDKTESKQQVL